jgi:MFS transporter, DHA1 family, tetracycline resistance protein
LGQDKFILTYIFPLPLNFKNSLKTLQTSIRRYLEDNLMYHSSAENRQINLRVVAPIFITIFVDLMSFTMIIPTLALYGVALGADPVTLGLLQAAYPFTQFVSAPLLGHLSDRIGRRPILLISQAVGLVSLLVLASSTTLITLFVARLIAGGAAANIATAQAALIDTTAPKAKTQALALVGAAYGIGFMLGPVLSSFALQLSGGNYRAPALCGAVFAFTAMIITLTLFKETLLIERRKVVSLPISNITTVFHGFATAFGRPEVGVLLTTLFLHQMVFSIFETFFSTLLLTRLGLGGNGNSLIFATLGGITLVVQLRFIGGWSRRYGERALVYVGVALFALVNGLLALTPMQTLPAYSKEELSAEMSQTPQKTLLEDRFITLPEDSQPDGYLGIGWILLTAIPLVIGTAPIIPSVNSMITAQIQSEEVGHMLGVSASVLSLANTIGPLMSGIIYQQVGLTALFVMGGMVLVVLLATLSLAHFRVLKASK